MPIKVDMPEGEVVQIRAAFRKNWRYYLQEALGLAIFMISACFFGALLESGSSAIHHAIPISLLRNLIMGLLMGLTALFIFYSPFTSPSGSHINPAVTLVFLRLGKSCKWDSLFYIIFQFAGGTIAVYMMRVLMGNLLTAPPVNSAATVPGKQGILTALIIEFIIAFITIMMVLATSNNRQTKKYTRIFSACLVCIWVIIAGPLSGFGMNPARSFASALPSHTWTAWWIYLFVPFAGMLSGAEAFLYFSRKIKKNNSTGTASRITAKTAI